MTIKVLPTLHVANVGRRLVVTAVAHSIAARDEERHGGTTQQGRVFVPLKREVPLRGALFGRLFGLNTDGPAPR